MEVNYLAVISVMIWAIDSTRGVNFFETQIPRKLCLRPRRIYGCQGSFIENYPNVSLSSTGMSTADSYFFLYTRKNRKNPEFLHECGGKLPRNTNFNPRNPTQLLFHGFLNGVCSVTWMRDMKDQLLIRGDYNVILVDWSWGNSMDYFDSMQNVKIVGQQTAMLIDNIKEQTGVDAENFHLIGHSLGAHIAGFAGQETKVRRISGLDPAGPGYNEAPLNQKLDRSDARLVDAIHTNGGPCLPNYGYPEPVGDADFYPNGGEKQYECFRGAITEILRKNPRLGFRLLLVPDLCYHAQSVQYYKATINPGKCQYKAIKCSDYETFQSGICGTTCSEDDANCSVMGFDWERYYEDSDDENEDKKYYLNLERTCPFCGILPK